MCLPVGLSAGNLEKVHGGRCIPSQVHRVGALAFLWGGIWGRFKVANSSESIEKFKPVPEMMIEGLDRAVKES